MKRTAAISACLLASASLVLGPLAAASPAPPPPARGGPSHIAQALASPAPAPASRPADPLSASSSPAQARYGSPADGSPAGAGSAAFNPRGASLAARALYSDISTNDTHFPGIQSLAASGIFEGTDCGPSRFCPNGPIDRKTMAVWVVRILEGQDPSDRPSSFSDVDGHLPEFWPPFIERMAELEVTQGCGDGTDFCPDDPVTRAQMAVFLTRAFDLPDGPDPGFSDTLQHWAIREIASLAVAGITHGCGDGTTLCPEDPTTRAQMATFLNRARALWASPSPEIPLDEE